MFSPVRILVLGGTSFVGRAIVADALRAGADVTLFGRGKTGADLFPELTRLTGDRDTGDYKALRAGSWNAVVDVSGYVPRHVGQAMDALGDRVGRYLFISSHAVYQHTGVGPGSTEDPRAARRCVTPRNSARIRMARSRSRVRTMWRPGMGRGRRSSGLGRWPGLRLAGWAHILGAAGRPRWSCGVAR